MKAVKDELKKTQDEQKGAQKKLDGKSADEKKVTDKIAKANAQVPPRPPPHRRIVDTNPSPDSSQPAKTAAARRPCPDGSLAQIDKLQTELDASKDRNAKKAALGKIDKVEAEVSLLQIIQMMKRVLWFRFDHGPCGTAAPDPRRRCPLSRPFFRARNGWC